MGDTGGVQSWEADFQCRHGQSIGPGTVWHEADPKGEGIDWNDVQNRGVQSGPNSRYGKIIMVIVGNQSGEIQSLPHEAILGGFHHPRAPPLQLAVTSVLVEDYGPCH